MESAEKTINVLHLYTKINLTCGISRTIYSLIRNSSKSYCHSVLCLGGDGIKKFKNAGINIEILRGRNTNILFLFHLLQILLYCRKNRIMIIHSHHRYFDLLSYILSHFYRLKTVTHVHSIVTGKRNLSYKADKLIAVGEAVRKHLVNYFAIAGNRISVIHNSVDPEEYKLANTRSGIRNSLNITESEVLFLYIGRFSKEKGVDILLSAFHEVCTENLEIRLLMMGAGEEKKWIKDYVANHSDKITIIPPQLNVADYYNASDCVILPSRVDPFPLVVLETGLMSKPFLGTSVDGIAEIIEHNINGHLFQPGDLSGTTNSIKHFLNNYTELKTYAYRLHGKILSHFLVDNFIKEITKVYQSLKLN